MPAALGAMAAHEQGKFWEYHDVMFENMQSLEDADLERFATQIGLDMALWKASFTAQTAKPFIERDMELATKVNARGTPNFFVNGRNLRGAVPFEDFDALITEELEKAQRLVDAGTPADQVYAKVIANGKVFEPLEATVHEFNLEGTPFMGNPNGDIVIAEFSDFQ